MKNSTLSISKKNTTAMVKSDVKALILMILPILSGLFLFWSLSKSLLFYLLGQLAGVFFFVQTFILLHEFGHNSFFRTKVLNTIFGNIISYFVFIPFTNWKLIHNLHHKWTGWRDKDPTTEKTFASRLRPTQKKIVDFCWKYYVPLFTLGYRLGIYWKLEKLKRHLSEKDYKVCCLSMLLMVIVYLVLIFTFPTVLLKLLPALYLSFIITDILSLSQHSHIEMPLAHDKNVSPLKYHEQAAYSRSLILNPLFSKFFLFNFNYHEAHHCYPGLPCYFLDQINTNSSNAYKFYFWLRKVKSMPGSEFIFTTSKDRSLF